MYCGVTVENNQQQRNQNALPKESYHSEKEKKEKIYFSHQQVTQNLKNKIDYQKSSQNKTQSRTQLKISCMNLNWSLQSLKLVSFQTVT